MNMWVYLQKFVYLLPSTGDESVLFGNTLFNVRENEERRTTALSGNKGPVAEFPHEGLDSLHIGFALLDTTGNALVMAKERCDYNR